MTWYCLNCAHHQLRWIEKPLRLDLPVPCLDPLKCILRLRRDEDAAAAAAAGAAKVARVAAAASAAAAAEAKAASAAVAAVLESAAVLELAASDPATRPHKKARGSVALHPFKGLGTRVLGSRTRD